MCKERKNEREREAQLLTLMREPEVEGGTPMGLSENLIKSIVTFLVNKIKTACHFLLATLVRVLRYGDGQWALVRALR